MEKNIFKFTTHAVVFVVIFILSDRFIGYVEDLIFRRTNTKLSYALNPVNNEDIVILGSSRAQHHYVPQIISDSTDMSCMNYGMGGKNIYYHSAIFDLILNKYTPKVLIYELFYIDFIKTDTRHSTEQLSDLAPVYNIYSSVDSIIELKGKQYKVMINLFDSYRYNSLLLPIVAINQIAPPNKGYIPINGLWKGEALSSIDYKIEYDYEKLHYLYKMISLCKNRGIRCIITVSPQYIKEDLDRSEYFEIGNKCIDLGAEFWYYEKIFQDVSMFKDVAHMNHVGAEFYSSIISNKILQKKQ